MLDAFANLNWLAIALAALAYYLLGAAWFTPLFGKAWDRSIGYDRKRGQGFSIAYYIVPLVSALAVATAVAVILNGLAPASLGEAIVVGIVAGLGIAVAVSINNGLTPHTPHPFLFGAVTGGHHLVGIVIVSAIIGAFVTTCLPSVKRRAAVTGSGDSQPTNTCPRPPTRIMPASSTWTRWGSRSRPTRPSGTTAGWR